MEGIPVYPSGDPVTRTLVIAGSYQQFCNWCMYSQVNPRSRNVRYIMGDHYLRGQSGVDVVFTGTYRLDQPTWAAYRHLLHTESILTGYDQYEAADVVPNVVEAPVD